MRAGRRGHARQRRNTRKTDEQTQIKEHGDTACVGCFRPFSSCDYQVSEVDRFQAVLQHPAFKANPFATAFEHLENSITSMHAKAAAKAEEKEIRSQSKVSYLSPNHSLHRRSHVVTGSERTH